MYFQVAPLHVIAILQLPFCLTGALANRPIKEGSGQFFEIKISKPYDSFLLVRFYRAQSFLKA
jgi:hypothetical protein